MKKVSLNLAIFSAMAFISFSNASTAFADEVAGGEVGNPIGKALCEVRLDPELFGTDSYKEKYKELLLKKGYAIITEDKKDVYSIVPGSNSGCFSGYILGHTCLVSLRLDHANANGDYAPSGLKLSEGSSKTYAISYANYDSYSLFFKSKLEDVVVELLKTKLITCEEAKNAKKSDKGLDFETDISALRSACERNESININTYNYYVGQLEKYKLTPDKYADNPFGKNTLARLDYVLKTCPSISDKIKMVNSMDDSGRAAKSAVSKKDDGSKAEKTEGASR